jgi:hypothetical protein
VAKTKNRPLKIRFVVGDLSPMPDGVCNPVRNVKFCVLCRTGFATPSGTLNLMPDGVCNPVRNVNFACLSDLKRHGRGCKPRPAESVAKTSSRRELGLQTPSGRVSGENVTDGDLVENFPVRQSQWRKRHGRGCKPRPAEFTSTSRTGLQTPSCRDFR